MPVRFIAIALALFLQWAEAPRAETGDAAGYQLGRGYPLGDTGIRLGGYASLSATAPRSGPWGFEINDISLFTTWEGGNWRFFSETEVGDLLTAGQHRGLGTRDAKFELERLYLDYLFDDALSVRFGKFLTPIGRWNLLHADPLVWTTTRPLATDRLFARNATGLMVHGGFPVAGRHLDYAAYGALTDALDPHKSDNPFENAAGGHLLYDATDTLQIGMSYANYTLHEAPGGRFNLIGVEGFWSHRRYEVSSEWVYRTGAGKPLAQGFVQGVAPLVSRWYAVVRYEYFRQQEGSAGQLGVFGLAFRPIPPLVWKVEYRLGTHNEKAAPDGLYGSFAVLF